QRALQVRAGFHVHGQHVGAAGGELGQVLLGLHDHQVEVERQPRALADRVEDRKAHRDVRDEAAVHDVDVELIGAGGFDPGDLLGQDAEVGGENRGRDLDHAPSYTPNASAPAEADRREAVGRVAVRQEPHEAGRVGGHEEIGRSVAAELRLRREEVADDGIV